MIDQLKPDHEYTVRLVIKVICTTDKDSKQIYPELVDEVDFLSIRDQDNDLLELDPDFQSQLEDQIIEQLDL